jgi:type II secretory pathway pseudopilin PulG
MRKQELDNRISGHIPTDAGFSIIEMLIAISVIVFGLVSIVGISAYVSRTNSTSATINVLAAAAQDQVDRLRTARWTRTYTDPMLAVGGSVPAVAGMSEPSQEPSIIRWTQSQKAALFASPIAAAAPAPSPSPTPEPTPTPTPTGGDYTYTVDPNNPHHATAAGTPAGDLDINWQVRQGATPDLRYVTIRVVQINAPPLMADGVTVTTIIVRN